MNSVNPYIFLTIVITLCLQAACARSEKAAETPPPLAPDQVAALVNGADGLFTQRQDTAKLRQALDTIAKARNWREPNFDVEWRFARYSYFLGKQAEDAKEQKRIFSDGRDAAKTATELRPERVEGHFWYGANLGELGRLDPMTVGLLSAPEIRSSMNKVIEIDPRYELSSAYDALAEVELETKLAGGSAQKAADLIETALKNEKENFNLHLHLAAAYLTLDRDADARKQLEHIIQMKPRPDYAIEYAVCVDKAKKLLATRF